MFRNIPRSKTICELVIASVHGIGLHPVADDGYVARFRILDVVRNSIFTEAELTLMHSVVRKKIDRLCAKEGYATTVCEHLANTQLEITQRLNTLRIAQSQVSRVADLEIREFFGVSG